MYEEFGYVIVHRYSNWQKKKVRTIVVNAHSKASSQKSIAGAIALAKPYDRIELTGGEYNEALAIQMPLELVAADGEDPHLYSRSSTITLTTIGVDIYMERLFISSRSTSKLDAAVVAVNGNPILFRCECTSMLIGGNALVHIDECTIKDSGSGVGLIVQDNGGGLIKSTNIRSHRYCCVEIDTCGELSVTDCIIENNTGGDAMVISGAMSSFGRDSSVSHTACSHVEVAHCHFSVFGEMSSDASVNATEKTPMNVMGSACCIVLTQGAAPTITSNELIEGEIGILIEGPGTAQLKGNFVRCQRQCGILALVEESFGYVKDHQTVRITGDNVLDQCRIGIDVQCAPNRISYALQNPSPAATGSTNVDAKSMLSMKSPYDAADRVLINELPNPRRAFSWSPVQGVVPPSLTTADASFPPSSTPGSITSSALSGNSLVCVEGEWYPLESVKAGLQQLVRLTLQSYPACLQPSFGIVANTAHTVTEGMSATSASPFADIMNEMLGAQLSSKKETSPPLREMLQLRGNRGVDIIDTRFSHCGICAIRFGRQGYGLVEECVFEDCGVYAIVVDCAAHPLITGCRFLRSRGASILVSNFANPFIIGNEMASGKQDGIQLSNMSRGLIVGNIITTHVGVGIHVSGHSQPLICANVLSQNRKGGVAVADGSCPTLLLNSFVANLTAQIYCTGGSDAFICRNRIIASSDAGIHINTCSRCTVMSNSISANGEGILVELDADPYVQDNHVAGNVRAGIRARNNALGSFVCNRLVDNEGPNVLVLEGASPVFRGNRIEGSPQGGVVVLNEGNGFFEQNTLAANGVANVVVVGAYSEPVFTHNVMNGSRAGCGVICARSAGGNFTHNRIYENEQCGVYICEAAEPTFSENQISREAIGVLMSDGSKGTLTKNVVEDCYGCGVMSQRCDNSTFSRNTVTRCHMSGLQVSPDSLGAFTANELTQNDIGVHIGSSLQSAEIQLHSAFLDSPKEGRRCGSAKAGSPTWRDPAKASKHQTGKGSVLQTIASISGQRHSSSGRAALSVITDNVISKNVNGGILLDFFCNATVERNDIFENNAYGVRGDGGYAAARAEAVLNHKLSIGSASVVQPQHQHSFEQLQTLTMIRTNKIHGHGEANILLDHFDGETHETWLTQNVIYDAPHGMCIVNNSTVKEVRENNIYNCVDGICCSSGGRGLFATNHIHNCTYSGVCIADMANPEFQENNQIEQCGFAGVLVDVGGQGTFRQSSIRHCNIGIVVFCGLTTPFQMSYAEVVKANLAGSSPTFTENTIEENELHGVLLLSAISGCPLRTLLTLKNVHTSGRHSPALAEAATASEEPATYDTPTPYAGMDRVPTGARRGRLCAMFERNVIRRNRVMGVYHDRFEHWDLAAIEAAHGENKSPSSGHIKNAYGGYEILLGTSQVLDNADHQRQRQLKQVSFVENTITECSIGLGAGFGCHPYLERNKVHRNTFFGLLLRYGSAVSATGNDIRDNGLAGIYVASGAKGYIANGTIEANNGWCRPEATPNAPRSFSDCIFQFSFFSPESVRRVEESLLATPAARSSVKRVQRAYKQMTNLAVVLAYTMTDALRYLAELVAASSAGLTLATGCVPAMMEGSATATTPGANSSAATWRMGGVELPDYTEVCTADGGIGVWIQSGSRVSIYANRIAGHTNAGVLVSRSVLQHHRILSKAFHIGQSRKLVDSRLEAQTSLLSNSKVAQLGAAGQRTVDIFSVELCAPALATTESGAIFTSQKLCVSGILAAIQVAASATFESADAGLASFTSHNLSMSTLYSPKESEDWEQRLDSIHHAHIAENVITGNKDGIWLEVFHRLQATASTVAPISAATSSILSSSSVKVNVCPTPQTPPFTRLQPVFKRNTAPTSAPAKGAAGVSFLTSAAIPDGSGAAVEATFSASGCVPAGEEDIRVMEGSFAGLDFSTVVEGNYISQNRRYGVCAMHVSTIDCGCCVANRGVLKEAVDKQYSNVRSQLTPGKQDVRIEVHLPFELQIMKLNIGHALLRKNDLHGNEQAQAFVTSRHVAVTQDGDSTLLQMDTKAVPSGSSCYASQVLVGVPLYSALLQLPPPGVLLWEENRFHDARRGVWLCGHLGPHSARFQRNIFVNIADDAFLVDGHLACATVGKGNVFDRNGVSLRISQQQQIRLVTVPASASTHRTRVFQNMFKNAKDSSVLLTCVGVEAPLLFRNEFTGQLQGSAALYLQSDSAAGAAMIQGNVFADSHVPVFIVGCSDSGIESSLSTSHILFLENRFTNNYIGALVCNGAYPVMARNLFDTNSRAGLEIVGSGTRPKVRNCLFQLHKRREDSFAVAAASTSRPTTAASQYPSQGSLMLQWRRFSTKLLPENAHVLGSTIEVRLPVGLLVGPFAEPMVEGCSFVNNDVGVDAVCNAASSSLAVTGLNATFKGCVFAYSNVCGVLVRGLHNTAEGKGDRHSLSSGGGGGGGGAAAWTRLDSLSSNATGQKQTRSALGTGGVVMEAIVFEQCVFSHNCTAEGCGDVVAMNEGYAAFRNNIFNGTVVGRSGAVALFAENRFLGRVHEIGEGGRTEQTDAKHANGAAVVVQEGGRIVVERNTIARRWIGVKCMPGAEGLVQNNRIAFCVTGLLLAPFNRTDVSKNRVLGSGECGAIAYGGRMADNEILQCPSGIVAQPPASYKGINAVPSHKRDTLGFLCSRNTITGSSINGLLIAAAGTYDCNNISRCKIGVYIACPVGDGFCHTLPMLKNSNVYDNSTGIYMENDSESMVKDNDVFDNAMVGVIVAANATGALQGNRISSVADQGAVEIPTEARIKSNGNVIRNQFSPAFQRDTRAGRAKEYQRALTNLDTEINELETAVEEAHQEAESITGTLRTLQRELVDLHSRSIADSVTTLAGSAGRALRNAAASITTTANEFGSFPPSISISNLTPRDHNTRSADSGKRAGAGTDKGGGEVQLSSPAWGTKKSPSAAAGCRAAYGAARCTSAPSPSGKAASMARRSSLSSRDAALAFAKPTPPAAYAAPKQVLIHIFAKAEARSNAAAVGQVITSVLAKPPLTSHNFVTTITTSTSQLLYTLGLSSTQPYLCIVVLDAQLDGLSPSDCHALQRLHDCATPNAQSRYHGLSSPPEAESASSSRFSKNAAASLFYTLVPSNFPLAANKKAVADAGEGMSVEAYANAHHLLFYTSYVEEVLAKLHTQISDDLRHVMTNTTSSPRGRRRSSVAVFDDSQDKLPAARPAKRGGASGEAGSDVLAPTNLHVSQTIASKNSNSSPLAKQPAPLTAEYVGALLSQLTPEALGIAPSNDGKRRRRRKPSVAVSELSATCDDGSTYNRGSHTSMRSRRSSVASKTDTASLGALATRRRSSVSTKKPNRRGSAFAKDN
ncbi:hypothetical protein ABL78_6242 [Leptomonas seymouri]|uniref:Carbohydrate-binding/sugar hydrolysis domain-containing protein n=1 Tax=Leptomonas seymouri TaxID=5684 RepID=A0A0N0P3Z1_LEPSE|nr:hypothetical protein ABL78_6242 [Leptomonas seymouri]|eukprot:KPI84696.1 hypothetical protein ABL78_6242 [Leptomonas seymouri]